MTISHPEPFELVLTPEEGDEALFSDLALRRPFTTLIQRHVSGEVTSITIQFQHG